MSYRLRITTFHLLLILGIHSAFAQDDLMNLISKADTSAKAKIQYANATFKTTRIILGQSVENPPTGNLVFTISHHFGTVNQGPYNFWGLDQSSIRLGLEYGIAKRLSVGIGRSSYEKTFDGFFKFIITKQHKGNKNFPLSISLFSDITINTLKWQYPERTNYITSRLAFVNNLLIARKVNDRLSLQITPSFIHNNIVLLNTDHNDLYAFGTGGRFLLTRRISVNAEYFYEVPNRESGNYTNSLSLGFDIETGGHVFQLFLTNSQAMFERSFITETQGTWQKGYIMIGFNIVRYFTTYKPKPSQKWL
jgi:hypothetical protein